MANFRKIEAKAFTKDEAIAQAPFAILRDATQAWKNAGKPMLASLNEFIAEYLKKHTKSAPGTGCIITVESGVADSREKPYKITDVVNEVVTGTVMRENKETGVKEEVETTKRKFTTTYVVVDNDTNEIIDKSQCTKAEAKKRLAELYQTGYKGNATCYYTKEVTDGEPRAFTAEHTPSINAKLGSYLLFGIEV
jgi:putative NIF3 family GTP cyclohydrolase 1 type 2